MPHACLPASGEGLTSTLAQTGPFACRPLRDGILAGTGQERAERIAGNPIPASQVTPPPTFDPTDLKQVHPMRSIDMELHAVVLLAVSTLIQL